MLEWIRDYRKYFLGARRFTQKGRLGTGYCKALVSDSDGWKIEAYRKVSVKACPSAPELE